MSTALSPPLSLYHLPLHPPSSIHAHVVGSFSRPRSFEVVAVTSSTILSLYRVDDQRGTLHLISSTPLFSEVLQVTAFRFLGSPLDFLVVTSDSGYLAILAFDERSRRFVAVQQEMMGKTGMRRGTPGHYVAVEPKGRALMVAALEKAKMTFILNRDTQAQRQTAAAAAGGGGDGAAATTASTSSHLSGLTISSPLEANKSGVLTLSLSSVDVGYDNPLFVALEVDYAQEERTAEEEGRGELLVHLSYYELDLGLNHVTRKHSERVDASAHLLLSIPGPPDGPGGVLIACESYLIYHPYDAQFTLPAASASSPFPYLSSSSLRAYLPRRHGLDLTPTLLVIASSLHVQKGLYFVLLQSELGDLYKVTLTPSADGATIVNLVIAYFDSIPPATSLSVLKSGYLFSASESSAHSLYQIVGLEDGTESDYISSDVAALNDAVQGQLIFFHARRTPRNLLEVATLPSLHPILDLKVSDPAAMVLANIPVTDATPCLYVLSGKGARSSLRVLRHGLAMNELALSDLPATPTSVFTVKTDAASEHHAFIIVSFTQATVVLAVGEQVEEVTDSGLLEDVQSLYVASLHDGSILQVHAGGLRHVRDKRVNEWKPPGKKQVALAAGNERTVVVCLSGGELVYFEMDRHGLLIDMYRKDLMNDVAALALSPVEAGKLRGRWLVVGGFDATVRVFSTDPTSPLQQMSVLAVNGQVSALLIVPRASDDAPDDATSGDASQAQASFTAATSLFLYAGLSTGVEIRSYLDGSTGVLSEHRKRFLGLRPLRLHRLQVLRTSAVLALADRAWLDYSLPLHSSTAAHGRHLLPLAYDPIDSAAFFSSPQCPEGVVAIVGPTLRILTIEGLDTQAADSTFFSHSTHLRYTPRKMEVLPASQYLAVIETDQNAYSTKERQELEALIQQPDTTQDGGGAEASDDSKEAKAQPTTAATAADRMSEEEKKRVAAEEVKVAELLGSPYAGEGRWASCISVHPPPFVRPHAPFVLELEDNEAAFSLCCLHFDGSVWGNDSFLAVGTAKDLQLAPRSLTCGYVHIYTIQQPGQAADGGGAAQEGVRLRLLHKTEMPDVPLALAAFQRRLLVGVGRSVRLYELGKRRLLKKSDTKGLPGTVCSITCIPHSERIVVGDLTNGFSFLHLSQATRAFSVFSDSALPRFLTAHALLDRDTVAGADKFGNVFVSRLPAALQLMGGGSGSALSSVDVELASMAGRHSKQATAGGYSSIAPQHQLEELAAFHLDSVVTAMVKVNLHPAAASASNAAASASTSKLSPSVLLVATLSGGLHAFLPLASVDEVELLTHLEMHLRHALPSLTARDHLAHRSAFMPVKGVLDGQLIEQFHRLARDKKAAIAHELVSTAHDVNKTLEDIRGRAI